MNFTLEGVMPVLALGVFGGLGSVLRLFLSRFSGYLPWGILIANVAASFVCGLALAYGTNSTLGVWLTMGLAGGLSTFSTWAGQTATYFQQRLRQQAMMNILANLMLAPVAVFIGALIATSLLK